MRWRRGSDDAGSLSAFEGMLVVGIVMGSVFFVATYVEPPTAASQSRAVLEDSAVDALAILTELPPEKNLHHGNRLEELVSAALVERECEDLNDALSRYFPPGVTFNAYLEMGNGRVRTLCSQSEGGGERITSSTLVSPHWSTFYVAPTVSHVSGAVLPESVRTTVNGQTPEVEVQGVLLRNAFLDRKANITLTFENGWHAYLEAGPDGVRQTRPVAPEHVAVDEAALPDDGSLLDDPLGSADLPAGTHRDGYAVPYDTDGTWAEYYSSYLNASAQDPRDYSVRHNLNLDPVKGPLYTVHPRFVAAEVAKGAIATMNEADHFHPEKFNHTDEDLIGSEDYEVRFTYNYSGLSDLAVDLDLLNATFVVLDPLGLPVDRQELDNLDGEVVHKLKDDALWGTYVAFLELKMASADALEDVFYVHQISHFTLVPRDWADKTWHIAPVYRFTLSVGFEDWTWEADDEDARKHLPRGRPTEHPNFGADWWTDPGRPEHPYVRGAEMRRAK